jgi:hypothetical protein
MKRFKKLLLILLVSLIAYFSYVFLLKTDNSTEVINLVPQDAVYIIKAKKPINAWQKFSQSELWQHLKTYSEFKDITESANSIDALIENNRTLFKIFSLKNLVISAHMTQSNDYDFLFLTDLSNASKSDLIKNNLDKVFALADYKVRTLDYKGVSINICHDASDNSNLYVASIANYIACSFSLEILKKSIEEYYNPSFKKKEHYQFIEKETATDGLAQVYINYTRLEPFLNVYMGSVDQSLVNILGQIHFTGLNGNLDDSYIKLKGKTNINDSMDEMLTVLSKSGSSKMGVHKVLSDRTAILMRLGFDDFTSFTQHSLALTSDKALQRNNRTIKLIELFMGISIQNDFMSWIGDELAVAQYYNESLIGNKVPKLIAIKVKDKSKAKQKLDEVFKKIKRRMPFKFDTYEFIGHEIKYMETKGLFRLIFGKLFDKVEKPYFCFLDDYVIFCDDAKTLLQTIQDYEEDRTLADETNFKFVQKDLSNRSSFFTYLSPKLYFNNMSSVLSPSSFTELNNNKQYMTCFNGTGFVLKAEGEGVFNTELVSNFLKETIKIKDEENLEVEELEELDEIERFIIEKLNGKAKKEYFPNGKLKSVQAVNNAFQPHGIFTEYWENEKVKTKGRFKQGKQIGTWRYYNKKGKLIEKKRIK